MTLAPADVNAANLAAFDTVVLNVASSQMGCNVNILSAQQKADLVSSIETGKKMIIYDSECSPQDYNWLPFPFTTANPGAMGAHGTLTIVEENTLSSNNPADTYFIDASYLSDFTDAVGDMNVMTTFDPNWFVDMSGTNILGITGPVHTYAKFPAGTDDGLFIYNGLDMDYMSYGSKHLRKIWVQELQQVFNPSDLPSGFTVVGITLGPSGVENTVGQSHTVTARLTDLLGIPQPDIQVTFNVISGPNIGLNGLGTSDSDGYASFTYSGNGGVGTDEINACFTNSEGQVICSQVVTKEWIDAGIDFKVTNIKPVQVVWDAKINNDDKIDLVAGKSTMIQYEIGINKYVVPDPIDIRISFDGNEKIITNTIQLLLPEKEGYFWSTHNYYPDSGKPTQIGDQTIIIEVDPNNDIVESDEDNNQDKVDITVKETKDINIHYLKVYPPISILSSLYMPPEQKSFLETVEQSTKFIQATYPIRDEGVKYSTETMMGQPPFLFSTWLGDLLYLETLAWVANKDRTIGIVDHSYFKYNRLPKVKGRSYIGTPSAALIEDGYYTPAAHEIGHSFGLGIKYAKPLNLPVPDEEYHGVYEGNPAKGFWVEEKKSIDAICLMGSTPALPKGTLPQDSNRWIENKDYYHLFDALKKGVDPNILLITGFINKDDKIEFRKWYYLERVIDDILPGEYSVVFLNKNREIIDETEFTIPFFVFDEPLGAVDVDEVPFVLPIPYPDNTYKVQIRHNEKILTETNPNSKLLHDAVDLIPDHGFINNPEQRRKALHNEIDALEKQMERGDISGARNKLKFDIKDKLEKWLIDDYQKDTLQYSKDEIIDLVDGLIGRLDSV